MSRVLAVCIALMFAAPAWADAVADCDQARNWDLTISGCTTLIREDPRDALAYNNRGAGHNAKKNYDLAIADFTKTIELDPKHELAYSNRGLAYAYKEDYDRAIADLDKAIALNPKDAPVSYTHLRAHETDSYLVCRLLLEK